MKTISIVSVILMLALSLTLFSSCQYVSPETTSETTQHVCQVKDFRDIPGTHSSECTVCKEIHLKPEACRYVREFCTDTYMTCEICGNKSQAPAEDHDMQHVSTKNGCWYTEITYACSRCGMESTMHGDLARPQHSWNEVAADGKTTYSCTGCSESITVRNEIGEFSYAAVLEEFRVGDPGVKHEGFYFGGFSSWETDKPIDIATKAKLELKSHYTVEYDTVSISFDKDLETWSVNFYTENIPGGSYSVYIDSTGCICYIVSGE